MIRKTSFTLLMLIFIVLSASCSSNQAKTSPSPEPNMPNPASVYCEQRGGKLDFRQDASGGVSGGCIFPDGSECDEWAYFRGECKPGDSLTKPAPTPTLEPNIPNPASVYCEQQGNKLQIVTAADGSQSGICIFPDGSTCDEWAYFRGECKPGDSLVTPEPTVSPTPLSSSPTPKPTVLRVAYFGDGHIMLWTEGQGSRPLADAVNVEQVRISDDGQVIAHTSRYSHGGYEILAVNADGTHQQVLVGRDYLENLQPIDLEVYLDFAPASHTLYFVTEQYDLHRVNADSGSPSLVFGAGKGGFFSFSPDGQWMTLYHPNELVLAHLDGSEAHVVFQYPEDFRYTMTGPEIVWKPNSSGFYMVSASGPQNSPDNMTVWFIPLTSEPVKQMSYTGPYGANLSPDGRTVVYLDYQHTPVDVHVVTADGKNATWGSYDNVGFMGWAPDSKHFMLNLSKDLRLQVPYLCAVGEQPVKLTDTDAANAIVWIDAQRVLFASHGRSLHRQRVGASSMLLDADASSWFDYTYINP
jgi:putative hemolysin